MRDIEVPRSVPRLTTRQVLTMSFVEGDPITRLKVLLLLSNPVL
jgi:predicted unusual protein kinase regulating ubiquinone biosynthesis (AarF/ABC1/UbiB family)